MLQTAQVQKICVNLAAQAAKKSVFIREICGTPDVLKTGNTLAISDISLIFAPCKQ